MKAIQVRHYPLWQFSNHPALRVAGPESDLPPGARDFARRMVEQVLAETMSERTAEIFFWTVGWGANGERLRPDGTRWTQAEIGKRFGIGKGRVSDIKVKGFFVLRGRVRPAMRRTRLLDLLDGD